MKTKIKFIAILLLIVAGVAIFVLPRMSLQISFGFGNNGTTSIVNPPDNAQQNGDQPTIKTFYFDGAEKIVYQKNTITLENFTTMLKEAKKSDERVNFFFLKTIHNSFHKQIEDLATQIGIAASKMNIEQMPE